MKLSKKLKKHIKKENFVKIYIASNEYEITYFEGFIFEQNKDYVLMNDMHDFDYDGFVIIRKSDIDEIKHTENEKFYLHILKKEKIKKDIFRRKKKLNFKLSSITKMMRNLQELKIPVICEHIYKNKDLFQIGIIKKVTKKKSYMQYFNARGEFTLKLLPVSYKSLTFIRIDSPYAKLFYKYTK